MLADLAAQAEVRRLAEEFRERHDRLDVLVNNAGLVQSERTETPDGMETTLAINHLAPFLLTNLLLDLLKKSAPSRVVTVSSEAQRWGNIDFDDLQSRKQVQGFPGLRDDQAREHHVHLRARRSAWREPVSRRPACTLARSTPGSARTTAGP